MARTQYTPTRKGSAYDADADEQHAPGSAADGSHDDLGKTPAERAGEVANLEKDYAAKPAREPGQGKADDSEQLKDSEDDAADDTVGSGFKRSGDKKTFKASKKSRWNKKRAGIAGGIAGVVGLGIMGGTIISGPAQLIHLAEVLSHAFLKSDEDSSNRMGKLYRFAKAIKARDIGETRVGALGSFTFKRTIAGLEKAGITIERGRTGAPTRTNFDTAKLRKAFPELDVSLKDTKGILAEARANGVSAVEARDARIKAFLVSKLRIDSKIISGSRGQLYVDQGKFSMSDSRALARSSLYVLENGKVISGMKFRYMAKFFNLPSLWHPLDRAIAAAQKKLFDERKSKGSGAEKENPAIEAEAEKFVERTTETNAKANVAVEEIKKESNTFRNPVTNVLLVTGGVCLVRNITEEIVVVNHNRVAVPAAIEAATSVAVGHQTKAGGPDVTLEEQGLRVKNMTDKQGKSYWNSQPLQQLADGTHHTGDPDILPDHKQAFSTETTAGNIKEGVSRTLGGETLAAAACSTPGLIIQGAIGIAAGFASIAGEVFSAGTLSGPIFAGWAAKEGVAFALSMAAAHYINTFILNSTTSATLTQAAFQGASGGSLNAYGVRELAAMGATSTGGIEFGDNHSVYGLADQLKVEQQQFQSRSVFARVFDAYESKSLVGHYMLNITPSASQNVVAMASGLTSVGSSLLGGLSSLMPRASALSPDYDWSFPQVGIPQSMLDDPDLQDPYENAHNVAMLLNATCLNGDGTVNTTCYFAERIDACFGNALTKTDGAWDVVATREVDRHEESYLNANCADIGSATDTNPASPTRQWRRIVMFVNDTHIICAAAQFEGVGQSCGIAGTAQPGPLNVIDQTAMYQDSTNIPCAAGTKDVGVELGYDNNQPIRVRLCAIPGLHSDSEESDASRGGLAGADGNALVNSRVSNNFFQMFVAAKARGISLTAASSFRTMAHQERLCRNDSSGLCPKGVHTYVASPGNSNHQMGLAIDFNTQSVRGDNTCGSGRARAPGDPMWDWLNNNAATYGLHQYGAESWHWDSLAPNTTGSARCGGDGT